MNSSKSDQDQKTITLETSRFGALEIDTEEIVLFPEGLLGFGNHTHYVLLEDAQQAPFLWLQSVDDPDLAFVVVDPFLFFPGYEIQVKPQELGVIELENVHQAKVLTIVTIPADPMELTTNLRGPLVFNIEKKKAKQLVLIDDRYHTKHHLLKDIPPDLAESPNQEEINPQQD